MTTYGKVRFGKKRAPDCSCDYRFTCRPCLRMSGPTLANPTPNTMTMTHTNRDPAPHLTGAEWEEVLDALGHDVTAHLNEEPCPKCQTPPTLYVSYEVSGVRDIHDPDDPEGTCCETCPDDEAQFWSVYGRYRDGDLLLADAIADCDTREKAERIAEALWPVALTF